MDKNTWIGFGLIAVVIIGFSFFNRPSEEELAERQRQDSIQQALVLQQAEAQSLQQEQNLTNDAPAQNISEEVQSNNYGPFSMATTGEDGMVYLENELIKIGVSRKGGFIAKAELKEYKAYHDSVNALCLFQPIYEVDGQDTTLFLENELNFPLNTIDNRVINTRDLYFVPQPQTDKSKLVMRLQACNDSTLIDSYIDFVYTLLENDYMFSMSILPHNLNQVLSQSTSWFEMDWIQRIPQQEKGRKFEEKYSQLQYMYAGTEGETENLSELEAESRQESVDIKWIAHKDQFFSTVMIAGEAFKSATFESTPAGAHTRYIKEYKTKVTLPFNVNENKPIDLSYYLGPNHYNTLAAYVVFLAAFSTFSYATNGIKAGAAASLFILALGYRENLKVCIPLVLLSWGFHHSMIMVVAAFVVTLFVKNPKIYFVLWGFCFLMAFAHITAFAHFFSGFTTEHGASYLLTEGGNEGTKGGFRIDFILYSAMPVIVGWYAVFKKQYKLTNLYKNLLNLYLCLNGVWMLCMYAEFTNRIAYLSWFIYPIVLIYPFLQEQWGKNKYKTFSFVMLGHLGFTLFMNLIYY